MTTTSINILRILALLMGTVYLQGCSKKEEPVIETGPRPVKILEVGADSLGRVYEYPGVIAPAQNAEVAFEVPGKIVEFPVDEGQEVAEGELLASLDSRDFESQRDKAVAQEEAAQAEYARYQELYAKNATSQQQLEVKKRNYEIAVANLKTADKAVEDTRLRAPFGGVVARKLVDNFENVQAKQSILVLQDTSSLKINVEVPERDWALAKTGISIEERSRRIRAKVTVSTFPDRSFPATLKEASTTADPVTRTFRATLAFAAPEDIRIMPGMTARATLFPAQRFEELGSGFAVPARAIAADEEGNAVVWKVDRTSMTVSRARVQASEMAGDNVEISAGLEFGDWIAVSGVHLLREGMKVTRYKQ